MKKKVLVVAPALSRSGYGEQARFAIKCLASRPEDFEVYVQNLPWGSTGWISNDHEDREYIDEKIVLLGRQESDFRPDISLQVTVPNEFKVYAPVNIGYTAAVETDRMNHEWVIPSNIMDGLIVVSSHTKQCIQNTVAATKDSREVKVEVPIITVGYPKSSIEPTQINLDSLTTDFNFLSVAQISPRKNVYSSIKCFLEEFKDDDSVGFVLKVYDRNCSTIDRYRTREKIQTYIESLKIDYKCKVYLLHGDLTSAEMSGLYASDQIDALLTTAHGEGFGLPIFEAATSGLPIISPDWGGQRDFLYAQKNKRVKGKLVKKRTPCFSKIDFTLKEVGEELSWPGVIEKDAKWAFPLEESIRSSMRKVKKEYGVFKSLAKTLQEEISKNHTFEIKSKEFIEAINEISNKRRKEL